MPSHICAPLISLLQHCPGRVTTHCYARSLSAQQFHDRIALLSSALSKECNVKAGDRIAMAGLNTDIFFEAFLAIVDAGAVACPLNTRWSSTEVAAALELTRPTYIIVDSSAEPLIVAACAKLAGAVPQAIMLGSINHSSMIAAPTSQATGHETSERVGRSSTEELILSAASALAGVRNQQFPATNASTAEASSQSASSSQSAAAAAAAAASHSVVAAAAAGISQLSLQLLQSGPDGVALICFTSGTTGQSKGAMLSHSALQHQSLSKLAVVGYSSSDVYLHVAPLFHIGGISSALAVLTAGGAHVFMPRYQPATALHLIKEHHITAMIAVPAMMQDITAAAAAAAAAHPQQQRLTSLQRVLVGGGTMTAELQSAVAALFPNALLSTAYGMTEASSSMTFITLHEQQRRQAAAAAGAVAAAGVCVGWPAPGIVIKIDPAAVEQQQQEIHYSSSSSSTGSHLTPNQQHLVPRQARSSSSSSSRENPVVGEVCTRGPHVMTGYWNQPDVTKVTITNDGWLRTGDLGYLDDQGCLWLIGRAKDMIKSGGENVHASEVESALMSHPAAAAAAAVGLDHARLGEQVAAAVVLRPGWTWADGEYNSQHLQQQQQQQQQQSQSVSADALQQLCRSVGLSPYKLPRVIAAVAALPTNSSGKVVKAEVKKMIIQQRQQQQGLASGAEGVSKPYVSARSKL